MSISVGFQQDNGEVYLELSYDESRPKGYEVRVAYYAMPDMKLIIEGTMAPEAFLHEHQHRDEFRKKMQGAALSKN